jgi:hypothetical protein
MLDVAQPVRARGGLGGLGDRVEVLRQPGAELARAADTLEQEGVRAA